MIINIHVNYLIYEDVGYVDSYGHFIDNITNQTTIEYVFLVDESISNKEYLILMNGFHMFFNATDYSY